MVCPMLIRRYAAGLVVTMGVILTLVPNQAFGRSGGGFGGRSFAIAPAFRAPVVRPSLGFHSPALRNSLLWHRHRFGFGAPLTGPIGSYYGDAGYPYYGDAGYGGPYYQPSYDGAVSEVASGFTPPVAHRRGCESQTVTVPAEHGEKRSVDVNIVRCY
jgi:hypothetical protein